MKTCTFLGRMEDTDQQLSHRWRAGLGLVEMGNAASGSERRAERLVSAMGVSCGRRWGNRRR